MPGGLSWQATHWICARCSNSVLLRASIHRRSPTPRFLGSSSHSRPKSILATPRIFVDDLGATLEAHRAANKARLIRRVGSDDTRLKVPRVRRDQSAGPKERDQKLNGPAQIYGTDSLQKPDPQASAVEDGLAEAEVPGDSTSTSTKAAYSFPVIQPAGAWFCSWRDTSSGNYGLIQRPWKDFLRVNEVDPILRLDEEIRAFERYMTPDPEEEASVQKLIGQMKEIFASIAPSGELIVHGSRYSKLASPLSDIDFVLSLPEYQKDCFARGPGTTHPDAKRAARKMLWKIQRAVTPIARKGSVEFIHARVPLIAALDRATGLSLQFAVLAPYLPAQEYTMLSLAEYPSLRTLYVLLHHVLVIRQLNTVYDGGLGSYPLLIMIVTALKHAGTMFNDNELAQQLLYVLDFWSHADLQSNGYSADPPRVFKRFNFAHNKLTVDEREERATDPILRGIDILRRPRPGSPYLLCLQDPADPTNDLGKNAAEIQKVQAVFRYAYQGLQKGLARFESLKMYRPLSVQDYTFLDPLVRARYDGFELKRKVVRGAINIARLWPTAQQRDINPAEKDEPQSQGAAVTSTEGKDPPAAPMSGPQMAFEKDKGHVQDTAGSDTESLFRYLAY